MNVYCISGLAANCKVLDRIKLPDGFDKKCIEWHIPNDDETLEEYALKMAESIDSTEPFILLGYSFGGMIIQEMNKFLSPSKNIIIASVKSEKEIPPLFRLGRRFGVAKYISTNLFEDYHIFPEAIAKFIYETKVNDANKYITYTDAAYMQWSVKHILNWEPKGKCPNLYHIHGTEDLIFPYKYIEGAYAIDKGDHLMILKKHREISLILKEILSQ